MRRSDRNREIRSRRLAYILLPAILLFTGLFHLQAKAVYPTNYHVSDPIEFLKARNLRFDPGQEIDFSAYGLDVNVVRVMDTLSDPKNASSEYFYIPDNRFTVPDYNGQGEGFACWKVDLYRYEYGKARRVVELRSAKMETAYPILYADEQGKTGTFENSILNPACYYEGEGVGMLWDPVKQGYRFEGWFRDQAFTKAFEGIGEDETGEVILYAKFVKDDHQLPVRYEADGGVVSPFSPVYANDGRRRYLFSAYKPGYRFVSWCPTPMLDYSKSYIEGTDNASPCFYAKYEPLTDIVPMPSRISDIGTNYTDHQNLRYQGNGYTIPDAEKSGYVFLGWYTDPSLSPESRIRRIKAGTSGTCVIYPDFAKSDYSITYENCTDPGDNPASFAKDRQLLLSPGKKEGAKFDGWYAEETFQTPVTTIPAGQTEPVTLYGKFTDYDHRITYDFLPDTEDGAKSEIDFSDYPTGYDEKEGAVSLAPADVDHPKLFAFEGFYIQKDGEYTPVTSIPAGSKEDLVVYAKVVRRIYQITYETGGGQLSADAPTAIRSDGSDPDGPVGVVMDTPTAKKEGRTFESWISETGGLTDFLPPITSDFTYRAGYILKRTNVSVFEPGDEPEAGLKVTGVPVRSNSSAVVSFDSVPKLTGYDFAGFYEDEGCTKKITWRQNGWDDFTVYMKFVKPKYRIDYVLPEGASVNDNFQLMYHPLAGMKEIPKPTITDPNLVFDGWYADPAYTVRIDAIPAYTEGDVRVYGKFHKPQIKVEFSTSLKYHLVYTITTRAILPDDMIVEAGSEDIVLPDAYAEGHVFCGWYKSDNTMDEEYRVTVIPKAEQKANTRVVVYAAFLPLDGQILYDTDGGENAANNPDRYSVELGVDSFGPALKPGYLFTGWTESIYNENVTSIPKKRSDRRAWLLRANYSKTKYAITYHLNGGYITKDNPGGYDEGNEAIELAPAARWGSEFLGWFTDPGYAKDTKITQIPANSKQNFHLYAAFKQVSDPVIYEPAGMSHQNPAQYEEGIGLPALSDGSFHDMTFEGWYADPGFRRKVTAILPTETGAKTLYARFSGRITYVVGEGKNNLQNPESYVYGRGVMLFPAYRPGCTFAGWYADGDVNQKIDYISAKQTGNVKLHAGFLETDGTLTIEEPKVSDPGEADPGKENPGSQTEQERGQVKAPTDTGSAEGAVLPMKKGTRLRDAKKEHEYIVTDDNPSHPAVSYYRCLKKKKKTVKIKTTFTYQTIKYAVTGVSAKAFKGCKKLKKVTLPKSIKKLGRQMFCGCKALRILEIRTTKLTKKNVAKKAFAGVPKKAKVRVPSKKRKAYVKLFHKRGWQRR